MSAWARNKPHASGVTTLITMIRVPELPSKFVWKPDPCNTFGMWRTAVSWPPFQSLPHSWLLPPGTIFSFDLLFSFLDRLAMDLHPHLTAYLLAVYTPH